MRRIILLCFTGTLAAVACDPAPAPRSEPRTAPSAAESLDAATDTGRNEAPDCGKTNIASDEYGTEIHPVSGPPGTVVSFSGTTLRGEDWRWAASDRLEAWWDTEVPSEGIMLVRLDDMERCRFETTFMVPDVEPGRYKISVFAWSADPNDGYGLFLPHQFTVTSANGECPRIGEGGYAITLSDYSGPPGSSVTASGTTPVFAKDGSYVGPRGEIQFWWNADPDYWHYALPGPPDPVAKNGSSGVKLLGTMQLIDCTFEFQFKVPDVAPGDYPILPLAIDLKGSGAWDSATFHAAHAPSFRVINHE